MLLEFVKGLIVFVLAGTLLSVAVRLCFPDLLDDSAATMRAGAFIWIVSFGGAGVYVYRNLRDDD